MGHWKRRSQSRNGVNRWALVVDRLPETQEPQLRQLQRKRERANKMLNSEIIYTLANQDGVDSIVVEIFLCSVIIEGLTEAGAKALCRAQSKTHEWDYETISAISEGLTVHFKPR